MLFEESARNINIQTHNELERSVSRRLENNKSFSNYNSSLFIFCARQSQSSQDAVGHVGASACPVRFLGQILVLLQYQTLAHRMKLMLRKAENLPKLTRMPGTPGQSVCVSCTFSFVSHFGEKRVMNKCKFPLYM